MASSAKRGGQTPSAASGALQRNEHDADVDGPGLDRIIQAQIGDKLRAMYGELVEQPVPDKLAALLDQLAQHPSGR